MKRLGVLGALILGLGLYAFSAQADSISIGFEAGEGYVYGATVEGQQGWSGGATGFINGHVSEGVVNTVAHSGTNSWYYPQSYNSPGSGTPFSPTLDGSVGALGDGSDYNTIAATLWFKADTANDGSTVNIYQGSVPGDDRTGFNIYIENTASGIDIGTYRWNGTYAWETVVTGLDASQWHSIDINALFMDDHSSDEIQYIVDSTYFSTLGNTWTHPWRDANSFAYSPGDSVKFASGGAGAGFYFDDISYTASVTTLAAVPEPASMALLGMGLAGLVAARIRRKRF